jgi:hypothetical protein
MIFQRKIQVALTTTFVLLSCCLSQAQDAVPEWFKFNAERPYAVFDAWKELSTREAAICLRDNREILAGRLEDGRGQPLGDTPISISYYDGIRGYGLRLQTDGSGYFIIYSPYSLEILADFGGGFRGKGTSVSAAPGFPNTSTGYAFAAKSKGVFPCKPKRLLNLKDRAFYILTCDSRADFNADDFRAFEQERLTHKPEPRAPWRDRPHDPEGKPDGRTIQRYRVRVVDDNDNPVDALVKYHFSGIEPGCWQVRQTDANGRCELEEWLLPRQLKGDFRKDDYIMRTTTIDAPTFGVGPVSLELKPEVENVVRLSPPAVVKGRVLDHHGNPHPTRLWLHYKRWANVGFEGHFATEADGTFRFERIMPNEPFTITTDEFDARWHQHASASSDWITLNPNEVSQEVTLKVLLASAIRGIVVSEDGTPISVDHLEGKTPEFLLELVRSPPEDFPGNQSIWYYGRSTAPPGPSDGRFGFYGLNGQPFRIRIRDYELEPPGPFQLEPGELRFIRVVLNRKR